MKGILTLLLVLSCVFGLDAARCKPGRSCNRPGGDNGGNNGGTATPEQTRMILIVFGVGAGLTLIGAILFCVWFKCFRKKRTLIGGPPVSMYPDHQRY